MFRSCVDPLTYDQNTPFQIIEDQDSHDGPVDWERLLKDDDNDNISGLSADLTGRRHEKMARFIDGLFKQKFHEEHRDKTRRVELLTEAFLPCATNRRAHYLALALLASKTNYEWELSLHHEPIHDGLDAVFTYYAPRLDGLDAEERELIEGFLIYLRFVSCGMRVEDALNINNAPTMIKHIDAMFGYAEQTLSMDARVERFKAASRTESEEAALYSWLANKLNTCNHYFSAVNAVARLFEAWRLTPDERQWLDLAETTNNKVVDAMGRIDDAWFVSELRAHRSALQKLREFGSSHRHSFEDFSIIYCFPFVIRDFHEYKNALFDPELGLLKDIQARWSEFEPDPEEERRWPQLNKLDIVHVKPKELTDVWTAESYVPDYAALRGGGADNNPPGSVLYKIISVFFPSVYIGDFSNPLRSIRVSCELALTTFGNHHLRMVCTRDDFQTSGQESSDIVTAHDIYCALRRASSLAGSEPIWVEERSSEAGAASPEPYRLFDIAESLVGRFSKALEAHFGQSAIIYRDLQKTSNVVCSVRKVSSQGKPDFIFGASLQDDYLSRLLLKSAGGPADRLEPWLCRDAGASPNQNTAGVLNAAGGDLVEDALICKTYNTTFISLPNCPNFICLDYEEMAEFVSTLDPLYIYWNNEIDDSLCAILVRLRRPSLRTRIWRILRTASAQLQRPGLPLQTWRCAKVFLRALKDRLVTLAQRLRHERKPFTFKDLRISKMDWTTFRRRAVELVRALWIKARTRTTKVRHRGGFKTSDLKALHLRIAAAKQSANEIRSPGLVTNSVYRAFLDRLIDSSSVRSLENEFDKLTATTQEIQKAVVEKSRSFWQNFFAVIAILVGLSQAQPFFPKIFGALIYVTTYLESYITGPFADK